MVHCEVLTHEVKLTDHTLCKHVCDGKNHLVPLSLSALRIITKKAK